MFYQIIYNAIFQSAVASVVLAQILKALIDWRRDGYFHWQSLFRGSGMPSSHTAFVVGLSLSLFMVEGLSNLFVVALIFSSIVIRDVIGDRVFAVHAENVLNKVIGQIVKHEKVQWRHLTGHTLTEVFAGVILGVLVTLSVFYLR